jgi:hypothetical protein
MVFLRRLSPLAPLAPVALGLALAAAGVGLVAVGLAVPSERDARPVVATVGRPVAGPATLPRELAVLLAWDRRRSAAWARGDPGALRALYRPGSATGRADVRMLQAYAARGLRLRGLTTQVLACDLVRGSPARMRLLVSDRVVSGRVVGRGMSAPLPRDRASRREITFVRIDGRWLVAEVRTPGPGA